MLRSPGWNEALDSHAREPTPRPPVRRIGRPHPQDTLALVAGAGVAFENLQLQLLNVLQKARNSLQEADAQKAQLQDEIATLAKEKDDWNQRAQTAEATLERANQVLQTQQAILEKALLREREAVQRAYMLELKLRQGGAAARPA